LYGFKRARIAGLVVPFLIAATLFHFVRGAGFHVARSFSAAASRFA